MNPLPLVQHPGELPRICPVALTAGSFDGLHLGHRALIKDCLQQAEKTGGQAWAMTFSPHPARFLDPEHAPHLLCTEEQRLQHFADLGLDGCLELPFGQKLAETSAEDFIKRLAQDIPTLNSLSVGNNWSFGYRAQGKTQHLKSMAEQYGFDARIHPDVLWNERPVSSTRIRNGIADGDMENVTEMLGKPYALTGIIIKGRQEGRQMGYPTANLQFQQEVSPSPGIYACTVIIDGTPYPAAGYFMPPEGENHPFFEAHILDFNQDLYGQNLQFNLLKKTRAPVQFSNRDTLIAQIEKDIQEIRSFHQNTGVR